MVVELVSDALGVLLAVCAVVDAVWEPSADLAVLMLGLDASPPAAQLTEPHIELVGRSDRLLLGPLGVAWSLSWAIFSVVDPS